MILKNYIFQNLSWPPIDENTNYIKELNNVETVRPISTKIDTKYSVAMQLHIRMLKLKVRISQRKIEELDQVRQYFKFNSLLRMGNLGYGGVLEMSAKEATVCDLLQPQRWKADIC